VLKDRDLADGVGLTESIDASPQLSQFACALKCTQSSICAMAVMQSNGECRLYNSLLSTIEANLIISQQALIYEKLCFK
jgi:hypothetical protein